MSRCRARRTVAKALAAIRGHRVVSVELHVEPYPARRPRAFMRAKRHGKRSRDVPFFHELY